MKIKNTLYWKSKKSKIKNKKLFFRKKKSQNQNINEKCKINRSYYNKQRIRSIAFRMQSNQNSQT